MIRAESRKPSLLLKRREGREEEEEQQTEEEGREQREQEAKNIKGGRGRAEGRQAAPMPTMVKLLLLGLNSQIQIL